jgi:hypothetical protein
VQPTRAVGIFSCRGEGGKLKAGRAFEMPRRLEAGWLGVFAAGLTAKSMFLLEEDFFTGERRGSRGMER